MLASRSGCVVVTLPAHVTSEAAGERHAGHNERNDGKPMLSHQRISCGLSNAGTRRSVASVGSPVDSRSCGAHGWDERRITSAPFDPKWFRCVAS